jgi:CRP/FNR family transcriptional regulator, cyclic AMP receptor protein
VRELVELVADQDALIDGMLSLDVKGRLAKVLLDLAERHGQPDPAGGTLIAVHLNQRDLAGMIGASRENVGRNLHGFHKRGFIRFDARSIRILDPEALRRLV